MTKNIPVIAIDGPCGSGKGAVSKMLAEKLGWHLLDSGAIYRILTLAVMRKNIPLDDVDALVEAGRGLNIEFINLPDKPQKILLDGEDITTAIRQEECGINASKISSYAEIRSLLIEYQRSFRKPPGLVADGRDMGTVVFPDASLKVFLTATVEERAKRRLLQLQSQGISATLSTVLEELAARDKRDANRSVAPMKPDIDAVIIDTTKLSINEVLQQILAHVNNMHT